jgi:hypothetical protein
MTKLATTVLSANTASVTFSNIPQNYTDLRISVSGRTTGGVGDSSELGTISFSFGSTSYTYSDRFIGGSGTAAYSSANSTAATSTPIYWVNGSGSTASTFASVNIDIPNYALNNVKNISYEAAPEYNNSTLRMMLGTISTTKTDPVTQIVLTAGQTAFAINSTFTLYGVKAARTSVGNSIKAVGGNISFDGTYVSHTFNASGTFTPSDSLLVDYLVVAGGGGSSGSATGGVGAGGGGAGGMKTSIGGSLLSLTAQSYTVTVGAGGSSGAYNGDATNGNNSVFSTITSDGGGRGVNGYATNTAGNGGSGGGGTYNKNGGTGTAGQGNNGGNGSLSGDGGAGGGGKGAAGANTATYAGANGGIGATNSISGSSVYYAGGGGGGASGANAGGTGGTGGGGAGGGTGSTNGVAGTANTGGGAGGGARDGSNTTNGAAGGSGVVVIRYRAVA